MIWQVLAFIPLYKLDLIEHPIGGFSTVNVFNGSWTEEDLYRELEQMRLMSYPEWGFDHFILDNGWMSSDRDVNGNIEADPNKFPHGLEVFTEMLHQSDMKLGLYASPGVPTHHGGAGSFGHELQDSEFFKKLGVKYLCYDYEGSPLDGQYYAPDIISLEVEETVYNIFDGELTGDAFIADDNRISGIGAREGSAIFHVTTSEAGETLLRFQYVENDESRVLQLEVNNREIVEEITYKTSSLDPSSALEAVFKVKLAKGENIIQVQMNLTQNDLVYYTFVRMANALIGVGAEIAFSVSAGGKYESTTWGQSVGHFWRYAPDVSLEEQECNFGNVVYSLQDGLSFASSTGPNAYINADILCANMGEFSLGETRFQMSAWMALDAPLILSTDLVNINVSENILLKNTFIPMIVKDSLHMEARLVHESGNFEILLKQLSGSRVAVFMLNRQGFDEQIRFDLAEIRNFVTDEEVWKNVEEVFCTEIWGQDYRFLRIQEDKYLISNVPGHDAAVWILEKYW